MKREEAIALMKEKVNAISNNIEELKLEMFKSEEYLWNEYDVILDNLESERQKLNKKIVSLKVMTEKKWADSKIEIISSFNSLKTMFKDLYNN